MMKKFSLIGRVQGCLLVFAALGFCLVIYVLFFTPLLPLARLYIYAYQGKALIEQGDYPGAISKLEAGLLLYNDIADGGSSEWLQMADVIESVNLSAIGAMYLQVGQLDQALDAQQKALDLHRKVGNRLMEGRALSLIGSVYWSLGQYERALAYHQQGLEIAEAIGDSRGREDALSKIGLVYDMQGEYGQALDYYQQALAIQKRTGHQMAQGSTFANIGAVYVNLGQYEQGLAYLYRAQKLLEDTNHINAGIALNSIGVTFARVGRYDEAFNTYQQALLVSQKFGDRDGENTILYNMGALYDKIQQYSKSLEIYGRILVIFQDSGDRRSEAATLNNMGFAYYEQEQYEKALNAYQQALTISQEIGNQQVEEMAQAGLGSVRFRLGQQRQAVDDYQQALAIAKASGDQAAQWVMLDNMGEIYESQGDTAQAIVSYQEAIGVTESILGDIKVEELKSSFANRPQRTFERLINLLWEAERFEEAFNYVEQARARAFLDQVANGPRDVRLRADNRLLEREQLLRGEIAGRRAQLVTLHNRPNNEWDQETINAVQDELTALEANYASLLLELNIQNPEVASLVSIKVASLAEIQSLLDPDTTLVEYFVTPQRTLAFVITKDRFESVALDVSHEELAETINNFRMLDFAILDDSHPTNLQQLHTLLFAPLQFNLRSQKLVIVPHSVLHYLPFAALTDGERYLNDEYVLSILPSASVLRFLPEKRKPEANTLLALGHPTIEAPFLANLSHAAQEARAVAALYGEEAKVGPAATESTIWSQAGENSILHLAAHGQYNQFNPLFSTIHLASDEQNDGRLEVHEIYGLNLTNATDLVVLSACQTQVGEVNAGDEVVALNRAFLYAGTPTVIASLWNVDDEATALLMERFYTHLRAGMNKASALRQAQIEVRSEYPHPYYWAAFVLTGDAGTIGTP